MNCSSSHRSPLVVARSRLAKVCKTVVITSTTDRIEERKAELIAFPETTAEIKSYIADLTVEAEAEALVAFAGDISILVNNAGMAQTGVTVEGGGVLKDQSFEYWKRQLDITLNTPFLVTRAALQGMTERQYGRICNITSVTGPLVSMAGTSAYSAAKGGMDGMMRAVAIECGGDGITINGVAPGLIDTGALGPAMLTAGEYNPIGRPGTSDEIAAAAEFLCTPDSAYITGQVRCAPPAAAAGPVVAHTLSPARCRTRARL